MLTLLLLLQEDKIPPSVTRIFQIVKGDKMWITIGDSGKALGEIGQDGGKGNRWWRRVIVTVVIVIIFGFLAAFVATTLAALVVGMTFHHHSLHGHAAFRGHGR